MALLGDPWRATVPSVNDCSRTAPLPTLIRGDWDASELLAGLRQNHWLLCVGIRRQPREFTNQRDLDCLLRLEPNRQIHHHDTAAARP